MLLACAYSLGLAITAGAAETPVQAPKLEFGPCSIPGVPPGSRCGTYEVFEDREARSGRKIPLRVVVVPATGPDRLPDPIVWFAGGPGDSAVGNAGVSHDLEALSARRDLLLVDLRGTGGSAPLHCTELQGDKGVQGFLDSFLPAAGVRACRERLEKSVDLTTYTSAAAIDDVVEVADALGYGTLNLMGGSYGTRAVLVFLRRHPERSRTATLFGIVPTDERGPLHMAKNAQRALDGTIAECEQDAACRAAFPKLRDEIAAIFERVEREPVTVRLASGEVRLTRDGLAQTLRYMLYVPTSAVLLALNVHLAAQGDWKPMAETAAFFASSMGALPDGFYLAITCAEDLAFLSEGQIAPAVAGTFMGDFRIRQQQAACAAWKAPRLGREFLDPVVTDVPTLLITGERDPVTPPVNAERVAKGLKRSKLVVVADGAHSFNGIRGADDCAFSLATALIESGAVEGLDTSCLTTIERPPFVLAREADAAPPSGSSASPAPMRTRRRRSSSGSSSRTATCGRRSASSRRSR